MYSFKLDKQSECFAINKTHCMLGFLSSAVFFFFNKISSFGKHLQDYPREVGILYFHTYVGSGHFLGFKILNFDIFFVSEKNIFWV